MRVLIAGWSSVLHGEATAGDVLAVEAVTAHLTAGGHDVVRTWSPAMSLAHRTRGPGWADARYDDVDPAGFDAALWVCGPLTGEPVREFHERFAPLRRIAVGVSVLDAADPAVTGFHVVVPRDAQGAAPQPDLAARPAVGAVDVVGVFLTHGQGEYGTRRRHEAVSAAVGDWLGGLDVARLDLETRLDPRDWRMPARAGHVLAVVSRLDVVVTSRLHGLVLALRCGVPALAVDPVDGGGKVSAQAAAWGWPALLAAEDVDGDRLDERFAWCRSADGRAAAAAAARAAATAGDAQLAALTGAL
ncbi:polysaccharide pyruvyl transferase family protein [Kineococcus sp. SYSU DK001]|uniref:polysaccharide pyruvyl transferase family protein n=1 Tax=Kineococcus sp. SYSU DK001 TaxID=3383122 RepID=UPI003D7E43E3